MERQRFSLYEGQLRDGEILTQHGTIFDTASFSRFKHGSGAVAASYGDQLAEAFEYAHPELFTPEAELVVTASISKFLPLASDSLADAFYRSLNYSLHKKELPPADRVKIHRSTLVTGDYSSLPEAERKLILDRDRLSMPDGTVNNKHLLVIDDLRMTGFHEGKIHEYVESLDLMSVWYLYLIEMHEEQAKTDATLEARMNKAYVRDLTTLAEVVTARDFLINSRVCKFIIDYKDMDELRTFYSGMESDFLYTLYTGILGNGYNRMDRYDEAITSLESVLTERGIIANGRLHSPAVLEK